jgi:hypothetical protein
MGGWDECMGLQMAAQVFAHSHIVHGCSSKYKVHIGLAVKPACLCSNVGTKNGGQHFTLGSVAKGVNASYRAHACAS